MTWAKGTSLSKNQRQKIRQPQRTHTAFDGYENVPLQNEESQSALSRLVGRLPRSRAASSQNEVIKSLLLLAFIDEKVKFKENNSVRRRKLFNEICQSLSNIGIVDPAFSFAELDHILQSFRNGFSEMLINAQLGLQRLTHAEFPVNVLHNLSLMPVLRHFPSDHSYFGGCGDIPHKSRYLEEFKELDVIGQGGFGIVFKAQKLVDNCIYAIKKISFYYRSRSSLEKVAREVEFLAKLNHPNIVTYKTAWIEYELHNSGDSTTRSSSSNSSNRDLEIPVETRHKQQSENDSVQFKDESSLNNYDPTVKDVLMECNCEEYQVPDLTIQHNENFTTTSLTLKGNCINYSCVNSELTEACVVNPYEPFSIKEVTSSTEIIKEESTDYWKMEDSVENELIGLQVEENEGVYDYDGIPSSSLSRKRHGSGATCKSHSDSEIDDSFTVQRKKISTIIDVRNLPLARCVSVDATCNLLPLLQTTYSEHNFPVPFSSWHLKGTLYIQMELCAESLRDWLDERISCESQSQDIFDKVCEKDVMSIFRQVLKGVEHIHSLGLIHRDLKPQNIFFDCNHSKVKIGDFGLAACYCDPERGFILWTENTSHTIGVGTAPYAALEQRSGCAYDSMADMYSLGVILVELLHPFGTRMERAECLQKLDDGIIPIEIKKRWPDKAVTIEKLLNKDPKLRPSATEVLNSSLFLNKTQVIKNLQKENDKLKQELKEKEKIIKERDEEIMKLKKMLEITKIIANNEK